MSTIAKLSVAEYEQIVATGVFDGRNKRRIELIRGELRAMNPIGSEHAMMVDRLNAWSFAVAQREKIWVRVQNPLAFLDADSEPEPDVVWARAKDYTGQHPGARDVLLLIEVADSSLDYDRGEKANLYAKAGVLDYWIVNLVDRMVEVRRDPSEGRYRSVQSCAHGATIQPLAIPDAKLVVASLFARPA